MNTRRIDRIRKRDGKVVEYDERKLERSIFEAARAAGHDDPQLAHNLANVVTTYLHKRQEKDVPASRDLRTMVEKVLTETGYAEIAREYARYSKHSNGSASPDLFPQDLIIIDGSTKDEVSRWSKDRILTALVKEAAIDPTLAREIADSVEQKLLSLHLRRVSTHLIRELVNSELISRGHGAHRERQLIVGVPKYDLKQMIGASPDLDPERLTTIVGETTLKQFALQEIFSTDVANAHLEGRIHIHHIENPLRFYWGAIPITWVESLAAQGESLVRKIDLALSDLRKHFAESIEINHANQLRVDSAEELAHVLHRNFSHEGPKLVLGVDIDTQPASALELIQCLERLPRTHIKLNVFISRAAFSVTESADAVRRLCEVAQRWGSALFAFEREEPVTRKLSRFTRQPESWFAVPQAVTINLPQVFLRADSSDIYGELEAATTLAVRAHRQKQAIVDAALERLNRLIGGQILSNRLRYAVGVTGLNELVKLMSDREIGQDEESVKLAIRIVSYLYYLIREEKAKQGVAVELDEVPSYRADERFSRVDAKLYPAVRRALVEPTQIYTSACHLRPQGKLDRHTLMKIESRFGTLVDSSVVLVSREQRARLSADDILLMVRDAQVDPLVRHLLVL